MLPVLATVLQIASCGPGTSYQPAPLPATGTVARSLIDTTPVIDIHAHTFNSRFLPIREIALGKRDMNPWLSLASDPLVIALTELITKATSKELGADLDQCVANSTNAQLADSRGDTGRPVDAADVRNDPAIQGFKKLILWHLEEKDLEPAELRRLEQFSGMFMDSRGILPSLLGIMPDKNGSTNEIRHFLNCLTAASPGMEHLYQKDHTDPRDGSRKISLIASHMMDMAPSYDQQEDGDRLFSFKHQQIPAMQRQQDAANGRMLYFVAYNPFRDHWEKDPESAPGHALDIVRDAYENHGAFGVKVYPPSGYAPANTRIRKPPFSIAPQPLRQWRARYEPRGVKITGDQLDAELLELFRWAVRNDAPVFAHCGQGEMQVRNRYYKFANPAKWRRLLQDHPELRELRLCLGHAGGGNEWFAGGSFGGWGKTVYELCLDYPNIYCEFGCHEAIADPAKREAFSHRIATLVRESRGTPGACDFSRKILYGSDWFMPMPAASDRLNYLLVFQTAILAAGGDNPGQLYRNFFHRNAIEFLNARGRLQKGGLPPALRQNLSRLIAR